ncbi:MAG TPA: hypothetical protein VNL17_16225 [Verrucomicrobiae bacterium]|nr:hypothetical protein [Verrucomicrobiae bacterium]
MGATSSTGSRFIPQIGHFPGLSETICGCIEHWYNLPFAPADGIPVAVGVGDAGVKLRPKKNAATISTITTMMAKIRDNDRWRD